MLGNPLERIYNRIIHRWETSGVEADYILPMRQVLFNLNSGKKQETIQEQWVRLPGLCCQGTGGEETWADEIASAWLLFYIAAHMMDSVEDQDTPQGWGAEASPGAVINIASGFFFSAAMELHDLNMHTECAASAEIVHREFLSGMLRMCAGQHQDLVKPLLELEDFFQIAQRKSGVFFDLACSSGARLVTGDKSLLSGYGGYGSNLGVLIQILDDLEEWHKGNWGSGKRAIYKMKRSLPVIYTLSVLPEAKREWFILNLSKIEHNPSVINEISSIVEETGAPLFVITQIERYYNLAKAGLEKANPQSPAKETLNTLLDNLVKDK